MFLFQETRVGDTATRKVQKSLILGGPVRDKLQLIKMAAAQAKRMFAIHGNVEVIDISPYNPEINGYVVIVEFEDCKDRGVVAVKSLGKL